MVIPRSSADAVRRARPLALALLAVCFLAVSAAFGAVASAQEAVRAGDLIAVDRQAGQLVAIGTDGQPRTLAGPDLIKDPVAVTAKRDGSVFVAEGANARILGILGTYALGVELVKAPGVEAMTTGADGRVWVAQREGTVGHLDLNEKRIVPLAEGLQGPKGVAERGGMLYVTETEAGQVTQINLADGAQKVIARDLGRPTGVAVGPGQSLFVSDPQGKRIVRIDDAGAVTPWVAEIEVGLLAVDPVTPTADRPYSVIAASNGSVVRFGPDAQRLTTTPLAGAAAASAVPVTETPAAAVTPTTARNRGAASSGPARTEAYEPRSGTSTFALIVSLAIIAGMVITVGIFVLVHEPKGSAEAGFEERPLDTDSVFEAFGPYAAEEVELAEAEGGLRAIVVQRQAAERRSDEAARRLATAKDLQHRAAHARSKATRARQARAKAGQVEPPPALRTEELGLRSELGREALERFRAHEIDARELEDQWRDAGERQAVECVQIIGAVLAAGGKLSIDEVRAARAEERARRQLAEAEHDREDSTLEIDRLREREAAAVKRIREARRALDAARSNRRAGSRRSRSEAAHATGTLPPPPANELPPPPAAEPHRVPEPVAAMVGAGADADEAADRDAIIDLRNQALAQAAAAAARPAPPAPRPAPPAARPAPPAPQRPDSPRSGGRGPAADAADRAGRPGVAASGRTAGRPAAGRPAAPANGRTVPGQPAARPEGRPANGRPPAAPAPRPGNIRPANGAPRPVGPGSRPAAAPSTGRRGPAPAPGPRKARPAGPSPRTAEPRPIGRPAAKPDDRPAPVASNRPGSRSDAPMTPASLVRQAQGAPRTGQSGRRPAPTGRPVPGPRGPQVPQHIAGKGRAAVPDAVLSTSDEVGAGRRPGGRSPGGR